MEYDTVAEFVRFTEWPPNYQDFRHVKFQIESKPKHSVLKHTERGTSIPGITVKI